MGSTFHARCFPYFVAAALACCAAGCSPRPAPQTQPADMQSDIAAIKQSMKLTQIWSWVPTFLPPDEVNFGTDAPAREFLESASHYVRSEHALVPMVRGRFGEVALVHLHLKFPSAAEAEKQLRAGGNPVFAEIDAASVSVAGNEAEIRSPGSKNDGLHARKLDGKWKIAVSSEALRGLNLIDASQFYEQHAKLNERLAADIAAGKFKSADEAAKAKDEADRQLATPTPPG